MRLYVCTHERLGGAASCGARNGPALAAALRAMGFDVAASPCLGQCDHGPNVKVVPGGALIRGASAERVAAHLAGLDVPA